MMSEPPDEIPVPFKVKASVVLKVKPFKSRTAPPVTEVPAAVVPNGPLVPSPVAPNLTVPALIVVRPVKVLLPDNVSVPEPDLVMPPPAPLIMPLIVNVSAALVTATAWAELVAMLKLIVLAPEAVLSAIPPVRPMEFPARVYPLPEI